MVFVLDASGSVGSSNFQTMLAFVQDLINDFDIGSDKVLCSVRVLSQTGPSESLYAKHLRYEKCKGRRKRSIRSHD